MKISFTAKKSNYKREIEKRRMIGALYESAYAIRVIESSRDVFRPGDWIYAVPDSIHGVHVEGEVDLANATFFSTHQGAMGFLRKWEPPAEYKLKITLEIVHITTSPLEGGLIVKE